VFYFQQLFQTAMNGIDSANVTGAVLGVAGSILLLCFLYSAYEAFAGGGDVRMLAISGSKYLLVGLVFANYGSVFRDVNGMFNSVANFVYNSTGVGDLFANWMNQLAQYWQANGNASLWNLVTGLASGVISLVLILSAFVVFPLCYLIFTVFYALYGSILYVTGPFILALMPSRGLGQLARTYLVNLMIFQAWGLIYAIVQVLMSAVNLSSIDAVLNSNGVLNSFVGSSEMMLLALTASLFSFAIALIPFIASRIVRGDVGSSMLTLASTATTAASAVAGWAAASFVGSSEGAAAAPSAFGGAAPVPPPWSMGPTSVGGSSAAPALAYSGGAAAVSASPTAPPHDTAEGALSASEGGGGSSAPPSARPTEARPQAGIYPGLSLVHTFAWRAGYSAGKTFRYGH
jgi:hypothetical protein